MFARKLPVCFLIAASAGCGSARAQNAASAVPATTEAPVAETAIPSAPPARPALPTPSGKPPEFAKAFGVAFGFDAANRLSNAAPQLLLLSEMSPQTMTDWSEDLRVMSRLVNDTIVRVASGEGRRAMGIRIRALDASPATYIEGFGVVLASDTTIPLAASGKVTATETNATPIDAWEMARRELGENNSLPDALATSKAISDLFLQIAQKRGALAGSSGLKSPAEQKDLERQLADLNREMAEIQQRVSANPPVVAPRMVLFDPARRDALISALLDTLGQATHFRHLHSDEAVLLTVSGTDDAGTPMHLNFRILKTDLDQFGGNDATVDELKKHMTYFIYQQ